MDNKKIMKVANICDTIAKVLGCFLCIGIFAEIFSIFILLIFGEQMYESGYTFSELFFKKLYPADGYQLNLDLVKTYIVTITFIDAVLLFADYYIIKQLRQILRPMKEGRSFEENVPVNLRKIAWTILASGGISCIASIVERIILTKIFSPSVTDEIEYSSYFTMDFDVIFTFFIIMLLSHIFFYGKNLQKESDETL